VPAARLKIRSEYAQRQREVGQFVVDKRQSDAVVLVLLRLTSKIGNSDDRIQSLRSLFFLD